MTVSQNRRKTVTLDVSAHVHEIFWVRDTVPDGDVNLVPFFETPCNTLELQDITSMRFSLQPNLGGLDATTEELLFSRRRLVDCVSIFLAPPSVRLEEIRLVHD